MRPAARRALLAAYLGTLIEWYDYALYGAAAGLVIGPLFFPDAIPTSAALLSFATFAVGFVVRPFGGLVISHIGDRYGRKPAMLLSVLLMGVATVGIGVLPTAETIGMAAPLLLILLRFVQGFGAGAELAGALTLGFEYAPPQRRGLFISIITSGAPGGALLATIAFTLTSSLAGDALTTWAWRVPFLVSIALFFLALFIRNRLEETPEYRQAVARRRAGQQAARVPVGEVLRRSPREVLAAFLSVSSHNVTNYVLSAFALSYLTLTVGLTRTEALTAVTIASAVAVFSPWVAGLATDRYGARPVVLVGTLTGAVLAWPIFALLSTGSWAAATAGLVLLAAIPLASTSAATSTFIPSLFPTAHRYTGVALSRELNGALIAGPTPLIATALVAAAGGAATYVVAFVVGTCLLSTAGVLWGPRVDHRE
ncbi:MFS transporter [Corynebacterium uterequi]|uniref:Nitrate/nitrite transporter n=1 Tax=Corynebacterium uterequi TaxID=1072256 RepID=A0A0G3HBL6_9CORY|nr:MFS transporter [Corynebacterium uterequi]AKK10090.1 nitrate/nitrite transporter [Corynebacterium uterequi]